MKKMLTLGGIALLIAALAIPAFARGPGWGGGYGGRWGGGPGYNCPGYGYGPSGANLTDEQRNKLAELERNFYESTAQLRNQIWAKRGELQTLLNSPNPDPEKARTLRKELSDLQGKMAQERLALNLEERKIDPNAGFGGGYGRGYGRGSGRGGFGGPCPGGGYGRMGGGYGAGGCWN